MTGHEAKPSLKSASKGREKRARVTRKAPIFDRGLFFEGGSLNEGALAGNGLDVSAYRCVVVAGRNRKNCTASIIPVASGCHPARAFINATKALLFNQRLYQPENGPSP
jgi:hypothetical protein